MILLEIPIEIGAEEARRRALDELAKAKYGGTPEWLQRAAERASRWAERAMEAYLRWRAAQDASAGVSPWFVIAVILLVTAIALVVWKVGLPRWQRRRGHDDSLALDPTKAATDYRALADQAAAAEDWRVAVRERFRAVVRELEVRTIIDVRPARTAWEAAYSASRAVPAAAGALHTGAELFNAVVYGDQPADATTYARLVEVDETVTTAADRVDLAVEPAR